MLKSSFTYRLNMGFETIKETEENKFFVVNNWITESYDEKGIHLNLPPSYN